MSQELTRITYVEDEPDIRAVAELALTMVGGFTLDICSSGHEAIEKAPEFLPELVLLDVMMPGMDGVSTFHALKAMPPFVHTPVIFMTAKAQRHEVDGYKQIGAIDVIPKPFDPMTLAQQVSDIWSSYNTRVAA